MRLSIRHTWDGAPLPREQWAEVRCELCADSLRIEVSSPFYADPAPSSPPGSTDGLWNHEVVELFLRGAGDRYLEVELGPAGHYWVIDLAGYRAPRQSGIPIEFCARVDGDRWSGEARVPGAVVPTGVCAANAFAIHGPPGRRTYLAAHPLPGPQPDFHQTHRFPACSPLG